MLTYLVAERDMARGGIVRARVAARPGACVVYVEHVCLRWARDRGATRGDSMGHGGRTGGARPDAERGAHRARGRSSCRPHDSSLADVPTRVCMADAVEWRAEIRVRGAGQLARAVGACVGCCCDRYLVSNVLIGPIVRGLAVREGLPWEARMRTRCSYIIHRVTATLSAGERVCASVS